MTLRAEVIALAQAVADTFNARRRTVLSGATATDGTKAWTFSPALAFDPTALALTVLSSTPGARARVTAVSRTGCSVIVEAQPKAVTIAGLSVLSAAAPLPVPGATVTLEIVSSG